VAHKKREPRRKHVPQRTCIACRKVAGKRALIRLVRTENGVEVDSTGKMAGRGAYLHPVQTCWQVVLEGNRLGSAMRTRLSAENRAELFEFSKTLPESAEQLDDEAPPTEYLPVNDVAVGIESDTLPTA
jgi:predicted RNA-binding protein YlxR (DUF448 family)